MLDIYLIRHAQCDMNTKRYLIGGQSNHSPLTELGESQAHVLGERLKNVGPSFDRVYSSPAVRAYGTARIACEVIGFPLEEIVQTESLLEISQGDWEGHPREKYHTPEVLEELNKNNLDFRPPNGESQRDVEERMLAWAEEHLLPSYEQDQTIGVFTHGFSIRCFLRGILDFDPNQTYRIELDNTSLTRLHYSDKGWHFISMNDAAHLKL